MRALFSTIIRYKQSVCGFSLVETAIVIAIIAAMTGLGLPLWSKFQIFKRHQQCQKNIEFINQVLGQYFVIHKYLPCPSLKTDNPDNQGIAASTCFEKEYYSGILPYRTLGIPERETLDEANQPIRYTVDPYFTSKNTYVSFKSTNNSTSIDVKNNHNQSVAMDKDNPILYVLVAANVANMNNISSFEKENLDNSLIFHDHPYSHASDSIFRQSVSWITLNSLITKYGQGILKRNLSTSVKSPVQHDKLEDPEISASSINSKLNPSLDKNQGPDVPINSEDPMINDSMMKFKIPLQNKIQKKQDDPYDPYVSSVPDEEPYD